MILFCSMSGKKSGGAVTHTVPHLTPSLTMLQNRKNVQCSIGILCVTFSTSIPSSDKWNPLKNSKDSWFGTHWRGRLCFIQVRSLLRPGDDKVRYVESLEEEEEYDKIQEQSYYIWMYVNAAIILLVLVPTTCKMHKNSKNGKIVLEHAKQK